MKLPSNIRFADSKLKEKFYSLENGTKEDQGLFKAINKALDSIEENSFCGMQIPKRIVPKEYWKKYKVKNLWKINLPNGWRLLYSIVDDEIIVVSIILDWLSHKEYENKMKY